MVAQDAEPGEAAFVAEFGDLLMPMTARAASCPTPNVLRAARADVLPEHAAASVRRHVEACAICATLVDDLVQIAEDGVTDHERERIHARVADRSARADGSRRAGARAWWIGAGAAMAASVALAFYTPVPASLPQARPAPPIAISRATRPTLLALDKPALRLPAAVLVSMRGGADGRVDRLVQGLAHYRDNEFRAAADDLAHVVPDAAIPQLALYLGVSYLQIGDPARAARTLTAGREAASTEFGADFDWYLAIAHARLGETARARNELKTLCDSGAEAALRSCMAAAELQP